MKIIGWSTDFGQTNNKAQYTSSHAFMVLIDQGASNAVAFNFAIFVVIGSLR